MLCKACSVGSGQVEQLCLHLLLGPGLQVTGCGGIQLPLPGQLLPLPLRLRCPLQLQGTHYLFRWHGGARLLCRCRQVNDSCRSRTWPRRSLCPRHTAAHGRVVPWDRGPRAAVRSSCPSSGGRQVQDQHRPRLPPLLLLRNFPLLPVVLLQLLPFGWRRRGLHLRHIILSDIFGFTVLTTVPAPLPSCSTNVRHLLSRIRLGRTLLLLLLLLLRLCVSNSCGSLRGRSRQRRRRRIHSHRSRPRPRPRRRLPCPLALACPRSLPRRPRRCSPRCAQGPQRVLHGPHQRPQAGRCQTRRTVAATHALEQLLQPRQAQLGAAAAEGLQQGKSG